MEMEICRQVRNGEAQEGLTERAMILQGQDLDREAEEKGGGKPPFPSKSCLIYSWLKITRTLNVLSLPTLRAFGDVELNRLALAFLKSAEAVLLELLCGARKNILTICTGSKSRTPWHR